MIQVQWHILHSVLHNEQCSKLLIVKSLLRLQGRPYGSLLDCKRLVDGEHFEELLQGGLLKTVDDSGYSYAVTEAGLDGMLRYACGNGEQDWRPAEVIPEDTYA